MTVLPSIESLIGVPGAAIRSARPGDRSALDRLLARARGRTASRGSDLGVLFSSGHLMVLDAGPGELGGAAHVELTASVGQLDLLVIDPSLLGQRLEARFLGAAEAVCEERGCSGMDVTAFPA